MLKYLLAKTRARITITQTKEEERKTPLRTEMGTRALVLGGHPYTGYVISGKIGLLTVTLKTRKNYEVGQTLPFSEVWENYDPNRDFEW